MNPPARLPASEAELDDWRVYADSLMTRGDSRGDVMAVDLTLPADPSAERLAAFRALARGRCRLGGRTSIGWTLGHAREIAVSLSADHGTLAHAYDFVRGPLGGVLERALIEISPVADGEGRKLLAALPPTCRRVALGLPRGVTAARLDDLIAMLPPHVRELELRRGVERAPEVALHAVRDRFDVVDLSASAIELAQLHELLPAAIDATHAVRVRLPVCDRALLAIPRCSLGGPDDSALVGVELDWACAMARWNLDQLQEAHGLVPLRAQWARTQAELCGFQRRDVGLATIRHTSFARRAAQWTVANDWVRIAGVVLPGGETHALADGLHITVQGVDAVLLVDDADARVRARLRA